MGLIQENLRGKGFKKVYELLSICSAGEFKNVLQVLLYLQTHYKSCQS